MTDELDVPQTYTEGNVEVVTQPGSHAFRPVEPFPSPATTSTWPYDEFAHDPDYLASQEALRSLLFTTARSAAPTRAGTPENNGGTSREEDIKHVLSTGRRVQYLKNYISKVAPWVRLREWEMRI